MNNLFRTLGHSCQHLKFSKLPPFNNSLLTFWHKDWIFFLIFITKITNADEILFFIHFMNISNFDGKFFLTFLISAEFAVNHSVSLIHWDYSFRTFINFPVKLAFLYGWYTLIHVCFSGEEMLGFPKILQMC